MTKTNEDRRLCDSLPEDAYRSYVETGESILFRGFSTKDMRREELLCVIGAQYEHMRDAEKRTDRLYRMLV